MNNNISILSRILLIVSSILLTVSIFVPIWQIELAAPQYPEGLGLKIFANKIGGDVDIINGLNHYIGMKTLHSKDFIEFTLLPYLIGFYALFAGISAIAGRKKILYSLFFMFVLFGIVAMVDFWRWEYNYGHNLDPHAAIIVPGMAYQPPLIGYKQLLNFGAYSIPDKGGWLFVISGLLMLVSILKEKKFLAKFKKNKMQVVSGGAMLIVLLSSCGSNGPQPIGLNEDNCDYCKMLIADQRFACELVTAKGRVYKFDDVQCMMGYKDENKDKNLSFIFYVCDYLNPNTLTAAESLTFIHGENIVSPMGGNIAAFTNRDSAMVYQNSFPAEPTTWNVINK